MAYLTKWREMMLQKSREELIEELDKYRCENGHLYEVLFYTTKENEKLKSELARKDKEESHE